MGIATLRMGGRGKTSVPPGRATTGRGVGGPGRVDAQRLQAALQEPSNAAPDTILQLQRIGGNRAVRELLAERGVAASLSRPAARTSSHVVQRHTPDRKPGEAEQDPDELQEAALQRTPVGGTSAPVQRDNIPRGADLPNLKQTTGKRLEASLAHDAELQVQSTRAVLLKLVRALATEASLRQTLGPLAQAVGDAAISDVREAYVAPLQKAVGVLKTLAPLARSGKRTPDATALIADVVAQVETALRAKWKGTDFLQRKAIVSRLGEVMGDRVSGAKSVFEAARGEAKLEPAYLKDADRAGFAAALKQLGSVQSMLGIGPLAAGGPPAGGQAARGAAPAVPEWRDGGKLSDSVFVKNSKGIPGWLSKRRAQKELPKFKANIDRVDAWLRTLLEAEVLRRVKRPEIWMHTRGQMKVVGNARRYFFLPDPTGFRPYAGGGEVHLSFDESYELIAHEMGHAIEEFLPIKSWHDMNLLLERRHEEKVGSSRAARTGASFWTSGRTGSVENEGRYAGSYVTGKYTTTAYDDAGNAEVFSQAMEFFSKPADAIKLIEGDPQHAAIVLRSIRPGEYAALSALRAFDKYLPIGKGGSGA